MYKISHVSDCYIDKNINTSLFMLIVKSCLQKPNDCLVTIRIDNTVFHEKEPLYFRYNSCI